MRRDFVHGEGLGPRGLLSVRFPYAVTAGPEGLGFTATTGYWGMFPVKVGRRSFQFPHSRASLAGELAKANRMLGRPTDHRADPAPTAGGFRLPTANLELPANACAGSGVYRKVLFASRPVLPANIGLRPTFARANRRLKQTVPEVVKAEINERLIYLTSRIYMKTMTLEFLAFIQEDKILPPPRWCPMKRIKPRRAGFRQHSLFPKQTLRVRREPKVFLQISGAVNW